MACRIPVPETIVPAGAYVFPRLSLTELTVEVVSFHPTATTFRFPAVCASASRVGRNRTYRRRRIGSRIVIAIGQSAALRIAVGDYHIHRPCRVCRGGGRNRRAAHYRHTGGRCSA